jgi:transcriptional regulator GlxA family with amidase domain
MVSKKRAKNVMVVLWLAGSAGPRRLFMPAGSVVERESTAPTAPATRLVQMATEYIRAHLADDIGVDDVVRHLGDVSRRLVNRRFRELTGNSVRRTIEDLRLEKVKNCLAATNMSIEKISRLCGYANTQRLKYVFKSRFGKSMTEWRKAGRT